MRDIVQMERPVFQLPYLTNGSGYSIEEKLPMKRTYASSEELDREGYINVFGVK